MTIARALAKRSLESGRVPLTSQVLGDWLGAVSSDTAGVPVTESSVWGLTAWYRAVSVLAGTIAALPLKEYRKGTRERIARTSILDDPNPGAYTPFEFWQTVVAHAVTWGTGYIHRERDNVGAVVRCWPVHPAAVNVELVARTAANPAGKVFHLTTRDGQLVTLTPYELTELPYLSIDGRRGLAPLQIARQSLGIGLAAERSTARFYAGGSRLQGVLQSKKMLNKEQAERLQRHWEAKTSGPENSGRIPVLDNETEFKPIAIPPQDAQLLESRKFTSTEIARLFGLPPHLLGDVEKSTSWGTGIEQQMINMVQFTLLPWLRLIEQRVTRDLLPGGWNAGRTYAEFSVEGLLRGDSRARAAFYHQGITDGWLRRNEARARENLEPGGEALDEFLVPSNLTLVTVDGNLVPLSAAGAADGDDLADAA